MHTRRAVKMIQHRVVVTMEWKANKKPYPSIRMVPFSTTPTTDFKVTPLRDPEYLTNVSKMFHSCHTLLMSQFLAAF